MFLLKFIIIIITIMYSNNVCAPYFGRVAQLPDKHAVIQLDTNMSDFIAQNEHW